MAWVTVAAWIVALAPLCSSPPAPAHALRVPTSVDALADSSADLVAAGPVTNCVPDARFVTNAGSAIRTTAATALITVTPALTGTGLLTGTSAISVTYPLSRASALTGSLSRLVALSATNVWALGSTSPGGGQLIWHWDGQRWSAVPNPPPPYHYDPAIFDPSRYDTDLYEYQLMGLTALSAENLWAVGTVIDVSNAAHVKDRPLIEHWNGTRWRIVPSPKPRDGHGYYLHDVAGLTSDDVWAVGSAVAGLKTLVEHWDGRRWRLIVSPSPAASNLQGVAVLSRQNVWAVGSTSAGSHTTALIKHWDGQRWRIVPSPNISGGPDRFLAVTAISAHDVWAVGDGLRSTGIGPLIEHWDGRVWRIVPSPVAYGPLSTLAALSSHDVWAVGKAVIEHWDGRRWSLVPNLRGGDLAAATIVAHDVWIGANVFYTPQGAPVVQDYASASCIVSDPPASPEGITTIPYGASVASTVVDPSLSRAFISGGTGIITVVDTARYTVVGAINLHLQNAIVARLTLDEPRQILAVTVTRSTLALGTSAQIVLLDARTGAVLHSIDGHGYDHVLVTAQSLILSNPQRVTVIAPATGRVLNTLALTSTGAMAADDRPGRVFITSPTGTVMVAAATGIVLRTFPGLTGSIAVDEQSNHVFIAPVQPAQESNGRLLILDATTGDMLGTIDFGSATSVDVHGAWGKLVVVDTYSSRPGLAMLDAGTGALLAATFPDVATWILPDEEADRLLTLTYDGHIEVFDMATGQLLHMADLDCLSYSSPSSPPIVDEHTNRLYMPCPPYEDGKGNVVGDSDWKVVDVVTGETLVTLPWP